MMSNSNAGSASQTTKRFSSEAEFGPSTLRRRQAKPAKIRPKTGSRISRVANIGAKMWGKWRSASVVASGDTIQYCFLCLTIPFLHCPFPRVVSHEAVVIDIKPLRYFVTLAETRHFGRAAARLNLPQRPLSRQLAALEASVGVTLVERSSRSVTLTAAGERFYADAKAILASLEQAVSNAQAAAHGDAGKLAIGFTMCAAYNVVPGDARAFRAA